MGSPRVKARGPKGPLGICLFGCAGDTGNLGVSALLHACMGMLARHAPQTELTVFDNGWGLRNAQTGVDEKRFAYRLCGARLSRRYHRPESFWNIRIASRLGGLGNPGARALGRADAVWDVSGGDSFGDLYGKRALRANLAPKWLALDRGVPLLLLPQTYGPFRSPKTRRSALTILRRARLAWARDERSFAALKELLGADFDPERHRAGVDMAFALEARAPEVPLPAETAPWLSAARDAPTVALNLSGLLFNDPRAGARFGLHADYPEVMRRVLGRFLRDTDARVLLLPHVVVAPGAVESDVAAGHALRDELAPDERRRVHALDGAYGPSGAKWIISQLDWFSGARMHACIAALSTGVPTAGIAYSLKMQGIFELSGVGRNVLDLRTQTTDEMLDGIWRTWEERNQGLSDLRRRSSELVERAEEQMLTTLRFTAETRD